MPDTHDARDGERDWVTSDLYRRLCDAVQAAVEFPVPDRRRVLAEALGDDPRLLAEGEALLAAHEALHRVEAKEDTLAVGHRIGPWLIVRELGRGGMGCVYLASRADGRYEQQVAIKLVRDDISWLDPATLVNRFAQERRILALLDHPNIARILDAGITDTGAPFLVMEYVDGVPIDLYCARKELSVDRRLELFLSVCAAVQHAHERLILHRDIKPSNVVVTRDGTAKLLDFGIAKLLDRPAEGIGLTAAGSAVGTPAFASPEQLAGEPAQTTTDVYALGVLLHVLLTGRLPVRDEEAGRVLAPSAVLAAEMDEIAETSGSTDRALRGQAGLPLASLSRSVKGDLNAVVLAALAPDPRARYRTAADLGEDLRRCLDGQPVAARSQTPAYRLSRFVRRHSIGVGAAAALILSLLVGLFGTLSQWRRAEREATTADELRQLAERRFAEVRQLSDRIFELDRVLAGAQDQTARAAREELVRTSVTYLQQLQHASGSDRSLLREVARGYRRVATIQGGSGSGGIGDRVGALQNYRNAVQLLDYLDQTAAPDSAVLGDLSRSLVAVGDLLGAERDTAGAAKYYRRALQTAERLAAIAPSDAEVRHDLTSIQQRLRTGPSVGSELPMSSPPNPQRRASSPSAESERIAESPSGVHLEDIKWVRVPAGAFEMGCREEIDRQCAQDERPRHSVTITRDFELMATEATVAHYRAFVTATGQRMPALLAVLTHDKQPVMGLSWESAAAFCRWLGGRLPTEAEWEYAARGGKAEWIYPWGDEYFAGRHGNGGFPMRDGWDVPSPVGTFPANAWGLHDMAGNVWEWVADPYGADYYQHSPPEDPGGPIRGSDHVLRGGSFQTSPGRLRNSQRGIRAMLSPDDAPGCRCARDVAR